jgi:geranylgeranylglycerol-phosphate geranylgeranyltransferase
LAYLSKINATQMNLANTYITSNLSRSRKITAFTRVFRIPNCLALGLLFISARRHFGYSTTAIHELLLAVTWILLVAFANAYNDLCDIEIDKINKPRRPLPSGVLSPQFIRRTLWIIVILIVGLAIGVWQERLLWPLCALAGAWIYSRFLLSRTTLGSNLVASCAVAAVPLSGLPLQGNHKIWALVVGITMVMFGREVQKDALDAKGDAYFRPSPLLIGKHSRVLQFVYPSLLLVSAGLLYLAIHTTPSSLANTVGSFLPVMTLSLAAIIFVYKKNNHQVQVDITKITSYSVAIILALRS